MTWDDELPPGFPIDAISRRAMAQGAARRNRRRARRSLALTAGAVLLVGAGMVATMTGSENVDQVTAGPRPLPSVKVRASAGKIAFVRSTGPGDASPRLFLMNGDGSGQTMVRELPGAGGLAWAPDGTRLALDSGGQLFVVNGDGTGLKQLTNEGMSMMPAWSPDGRRIAYRNVGATGRNGLWVMNADGTDQQLLVEGMMLGNPTWSPDGGSIAYSDGEAGTDVSGISVVGVDGRGEKRTLPTEGHAEDPSWSPDGTRIAVRRAQDISVVIADGSELRTLASPPPTGNPTPPGGGTAVRPRWSPDGTKIVYTLLTTGASCAIWTMNADGSGQTRLTDGRTCDRDASWQPIPRS